MTNEQCVGCFRTLSEDTRIQILRALKEKPMNVQMVHRCFELSQPTITHHLQNLERLGVVKREKRGREVWYSYNQAFVCGTCKVFPHI